MANKQALITDHQTVHIVAFEPKYQAAFKQLNEEWISQHFTMEEADYKSLDHPNDYILAKGGHILIALLDKQPVGTCALIKMDEEQFELAKMAVSPAAQGKGIGKLIGHAAIKLAKQLGATSLYLESNTKLEPAINLYHKLGFKKITGTPSPYQRCNIQMLLALAEQN